MSPRLSIGDQLLNAALGLMRVDKSGAGELLSPTRETIELIESCGAVVEHRAQLLAGEMYLFIAGGAIHYSTLSRFQVKQ